MIFFWFPTGIFHRRQFCSRHGQTLNVSTSPGENLNRGLPRCGRLAHFAKPNFRWYTQNDLVFEIKF